MSVAPVMHFEFIARDRQALAGFYSTLFGWRQTEYPGFEYTMLGASSGRGIDGGIGGPETGMPPGLTVYAQVDDVEAALDKAVSLGARVLMQPYDVPGVGRFAVFTDPEGNRVGLWKAPTDAA